MIEIWQECAIFQITIQRLANQVRKIINKGWFSGLEILEIHQKINHEQDNNTVPDTSKMNYQKQTCRNESPTSETPDNQTKHNQTTQKNTITRTKGNSREFKENYEQWKDYLTITKKHRMESI